MINCRHNEEDKAQTTTERVRGSGALFRYCVKLCALEHEFSARAFPGIVLDLLLNNGGGDSSSDEIILRKLNDDRSSSFANEQLPECFTLLINLRLGWPEWQ